MVSLALLITAVPTAATPVQLAGRESALNRVAVVSDSYTTGTDLGGLGANGWPALAWRMLADQGRPVTADVAAEGRAGYGVRGDHNSTFGDLTARAVRPDDALVVFFGSRNDQPVDALEVAGLARNAFELARRRAPTARLLVIGPPWPTADVPVRITQIRDALALVAMASGARFVDPLVERWFVGRPELIAIDGVHPTDTGHRYLAERISALIAAELPPVR
ncbi:SGNH/GDSL hydrolase family protein [Mycolicibacterium sp. P9-22]|nr:GDSL lipase [Mycolicibacterium sp. P9-22]KAA0108807.1 SGNH/GDSL hydrolase family protein [Mycolicibacterium sp. P9-22]